MLLGDHTYQRDILHDFVKYLLCFSTHSIRTLLLLNSSSQSFSTRSTTHVSAGGLLRLSPPRTSVLVLQSTRSKMSIFLALCLFKVLEWILGLSILHSAFLAYTSSINKDPSIRITKELRNLMMRNNWDKQGLGQSINLTFHKKTSSSFRT